MKLIIDLCNEILRNPEDAMIPADDILQKGKYSGGYEAEVGKFLFGFIPENGTRDNELWFHLTLEEVTTIASGQQCAVDVFPARW